MKTAREITKRALELRFQHLLATDGDADAILAALAAEGYQIVPPGGIHECVACEGNPKAPNIPCAVCGRAALREATDE